MSSRSAFTFGQKEGCQEKNHRSDSLTKHHIQPVKVIDEDHSLTQCTIVRFPQLDSDKLQFLTERESKDRKESFEFVGRVTDAVTSQPVWYRSKRGLTRIKEMSGVWKGGGEGEGGKQRVG